MEANFRNNHRMRSAVAELPGIRKIVCAVILSWIAVFSFTDCTAQRRFPTGQWDTITLSGTKNHALDDTRQGNIADCWLLSTVNGMRYTKAGREMFMNLITYHNGYSTVHLYNKDYDVYDKEVNRNCYSRGDYDMNMIEVAIEHALDEYNAGKLALPEALQFEKICGDEQSSINYGYEDIAMYFITGTVPLYFNLTKHSDKLEMIYSILENREAYIVTTSTKENTQLYDVSGKTVHISKCHTYSMAGADEKTVSIVNPDDTSKVITISKTDFANTFVYIVYCPVS